MDIDSKPLHILLLTSNEWNAHLLLFSVVGNVLAFLQFCIICNNLKAIIDSVSDYIGKHFVFVIFDGRGFVNGRVFINVQNTWNDIMW